MSSFVSVFSKEENIILSTAFFNLDNIKAKQAEIFNPVSTDSDNVPPVDRIPLMMETYMLTVRPCDNPTRSSPMNKSDVHNVVSSYMAWNRWKRDSQFRFTIKIIAVCISLDYLTALKQLQKLISVNYTQNNKGNKGQWGAKTKNMSQQNTDIVLVVDLTTLSLSA